jgi:N6-L-threonylcarbamoyladenine synthase
MLLRPIALQGLLRPRPASHPRLHPHPRFLLTLAIETSCDDTSVAVLEKTTCTSTGRTIAKLHFHKKITSNNVAFNGVHPLVALESHQENLARLVAEAIDNLPSSKLGNALAKGCIDEDELGSRVHYEVNEEHTIFKKRLPDFISVTRGPGMRSNLFTGLDTAKGLAVAWQKPLVGVHHMQAHALTPRLVDALQTRGTTRMLPEASTGSINSESHCYGRPGVQSIKPIHAEPDFPFLSVLASGGHTLLVRSASLTDHEIMASTSDISIGECLDKIARIVLPPEVLQTAGSTMYGALLETFAFPHLDAPNKEPEPAVGNDAEDKPSFLRRLFASPPPEPPTFVLENSTAAEYRSKYKAHYTYAVPKNHEEALKRNISMWGWGFNQPLSTAQGGLKSKSMEMSFSGLTTAVERVVRYESDPHIHKLTKIERRPDEISPQERRDLAHHAMRAAFE